MAAYWYVFNPKGFAPRHKHISAESAINEARRLASVNIGERFEVLRCVGVAHVEPKPDSYKSLEPAPLLEDFFSGTPKKNSLF